MYPVIIIISAMERGAQSCKFSPFRTQILLGCFVVNHLGVQLTSQPKISGVHLPYFPYWFNSENWAAMPQRKAKLWKFENIRTLAVADTREEVMRYVWNSYPDGGLFWAKFLNENSATNNYKYGKITQNA